MKASRVIIVSAFYLLLAGLCSCSEIENKYNRFVQISNKMNAEAQARGEETHVNNAKKGSLQFYDGEKEKHSHEMRILTSDAMNERIQKVMQDDYEELTDFSWFVQPDYSPSKGLITASGWNEELRQTRAVDIMFDEKKNAVTVGIWRSGNKVQLYAEDDAAVPSEMQKWADATNNEAEEPAEESSATVVAAPQPEEVEPTFQRSEARNALYMCVLCAISVQKPYGISPRPSRCSAGEGNHRWEQLGIVGSTSFSCRYCSSTVSLADNPHNIRCPSSDGGPHRWDQL